MSKAKNFFLMLKQGIKGVFQFKAQFIIIIILAFVATFILSISLSTQLNVEHSYDKIVKPINRFTASGNVQLDSSANKFDDPVILATEIDSSTPTDYKVINNDDKDNQRVSSDVQSYNYVYSNQDDFYKDSDKKPIKTFLTDGTKEFISNIGNESQVWSEAAVHLNELYLENVYLELNEISDAKTAGKALDSINEQIKYSPVGIFTYMNPYWYKNFVTIENNEVKGFNFDAEGPHKDVFNNIAWGTAQLTGFLSNVISNYNSANAADKSVQITNTNQAVAFLFGIKVNGTTPINPNWIIDGSTIKHYSINAQEYTLQNSETKAGKNVYAVYDKNSSAKSTDTTPSAAIYYSGLRGISNPLIDGNTRPKSNEDDDFWADDFDESTFSPSLINNWDYFTPLSINPIAMDTSSVDNTVQIASLYEAMANDGDWYSQNMDQASLYPTIVGTWESKAVPLETAFRTHNELSATVAGFNYKIRRESTFFDANSQLKFRAIALDKHEDYNFTILRGRFPTTGEVALSEQFLRKNNLKIGDFFWAGDAPFLITGAATDAMSYMPSQDLDNPIPNPSVSSFVYADQPTIDEIWGGTRTSAQSTDSVTQNFSYFLFNNNNGYASGTDVQRENAYFALSSNKKDYVLNNLNAVKELVKNKTVGDSIVGTNTVIDAFDKSPYRYSWTLEPLVFTVYDAITFTAAAIIALIAVISICVCVKKTIDLNSKQIGILKALGENPNAISINYLSYSLIIGFIVVPIAWIIGMVLQIPFGNMFFTYFSVTPDIILWDWISFLIAFAVCGVLSGGVSYLTAWLLTDKPVLSILTSSIKWGRLRFIDFLKNKAFRSAPFSTRFSLTLTSSGSKQIVLMAVVMFIASLLMSAALAIPSVVTRVNNTYYASVRYANQYEEEPMIGNAPLSKSSISNWNGQDYLDQQYVNANLELDNTDARYGYYKDPEAYTASISDSSTFAPYIYDANSKQDNFSDKWNQNEMYPDVYQYILKHQQQILSIVGTMFGNNYFTHLGVSFSVGMVDKFYGTMLHSLEDLTHLDTSSQTGVYSDQLKLNEARFLSGWLTSSIPKVIGAIVNSNAANSGMNGVSETGIKAETWKQKVMDSIYKVVPAYVKAYIQKSDSRLDQYAIAFNNDIYIPGQETFTTNVKNNHSVVAGRNQEMTLTGLDKYQNSLVIDNDAIKKAYLPKDIKQKVYNVINAPVGMNNKEDISYEGIKIYDHNSNTLTIPVIPNQQGASAFNLDLGQTFENWDNNVQLIQFNSHGNYYDLPSTAWAYDDSDFASFLSKEDTLMSKADNKLPPYVGSDIEYDSQNPNLDWRYEKVGDKYYLDPSKIDNNKLTYTQEFNSDGSMKNKALLFKTFKYDQDANPSGTYLRPYYQYKNMKLFIPKGWVDEDKVLWNDGKAHTDNNIETKGWYNDSVSANDIPKSVMDGYKKLANANTKLNQDLLEGDWLEINPYDVNYFANEFQKHQKMALTNLVDGPGYWYRWIFSGTPQFRVANNVPLDTLFAESGAKGLKVNLKSVGLIDSYNDKLVVADSDLVNKLINYPTSRNYEYNYQTFDRSTKVAAGQNVDGYGTSQFDRYQLVNTGKKDFINSNWTSDEDRTRDIWQLSYQPYIDAIGGNQNILNYAPHNFYNAKLSNVDEPLAYTSQISFSKDVRVGQAAISLGDNEPGGTPSIIKSSTLLSTTKQLISQVAVLAIAIGAMLVVAIIITAALLTMLTGDIYIEQYKRFMVLLRALGYSKTQIFTYTFGTVTILSLIAWIGGTILAWGLIFIGVTILWNSGMAIPMGITWWPIVISFFVMFLSYAGSLFVSSSKARKANPSEVLTATAE